MTIINNKYKFIFVHIPKNAGTSISNFFSLYNTPIDIEIGGTKIGEILQEEYKLRYGINKHSPANQLAGKLNTIWDTYYKFAVIRNPYTRFLSAYNFLKIWGKNKYDGWAESINKSTDVNDFIYSEAVFDNQFPSNMLLPQSDWVTDENRLIVNSLIRFEYLYQDVSVVLKDLNHIDGNANLIKKINSSNLESNNFQDIYNHNSISFINEYYAKDFINFNYEKI